MTTRRRFDAWTLAGALALTTVWTTGWAGADDIGTAPDVQPELTTLAAIALPAALDLGVQVAATTADTTVWIVNPTDTPMRVAAARGSCGCITFPGFKPLSVPPRRAVEVPVTIKASKEPGKKKTKKITFMIDQSPPLVVPVTVESADEHALLTAPTTKVPARPLQAAPGSIEFGVVPAGVRRDATVWLVNTSAHPLQLTGAKASCGCTTLPTFSRQALAPGEVTALPFSTRASKKTGKREELHLSVSVEGQKPLKVPVFIESVDTHARQR